MTHSVIKLVLCHLLGLIIIKGKQLQEAFNNDIHSVAKPVASLTPKWSSERYYIAEVKH